MAKTDADLFLNWAADEFVAAGRAPESGERRLHRLKAEMFCDIFHALNDSHASITPRPRTLIDEMLNEAYGAQARSEQG